MALLQMLKILSVHQNSLAGLVLSSTADGMLSITSLIFQLLLLIILSGLLAHLFSFLGLMSSFGITYLPTMYTA